MAKKSYPEIDAIKTAKEVRAALRMGYNTLDNIKPEFKQDLEDRLAALEARLALLQGGGK